MTDPPTVAAPPQLAANLDADRSVLACALQYRDALAAARRRLGDEACFFSPADCRLWEALCRLHDSGIEADPTTLLGQFPLQERERLRDYVFTLNELPVLIANLAEYCRLVDEARALRALGGLAVSDAQARGCALTDIGNGQRFAAAQRGRLYHDAARGWLSYEPRRGVFVAGQAGAERAAKQTAISIYAEAARGRDDAERKAISAWAHASESLPRQAAMLKMAESEELLQLPEDGLDPDPWLLCVRNGVVDLRSGWLRAHSPSYRMSRCAGTVYDPAADCPRWRAHLERVLAGSRELIDYLQRWCGYCLTGLTSEQKLAILYGLGANGKSVTTQLLAAVFGDYAVTADFTTFSARRSDGPRNDLAALAGARLVLASETRESQALDEALVKQVSGGDRIVARFLHREYFAFVPQFKIILSTNHKPAIAGSDHGIWRRVDLLPFSVTIPAAEQQRDLVTHLCEELAGILAWMVGGCLAWQREGLPTPELVRCATESYRLEMDALGSFLDECTRADTQAAVSAGELYGAYRQWAVRSGEVPLNQRAFSQRLAERGLRTAARREPGSGRKLYQGLSLARVSEGEPL